MGFRRYKGNPQGPAPMPTAGSEISLSPPGPSAFSLIELLMVIAIIGILASLLMPALNSAQDKSGRVTCQNHLKQLALAATIYAADNDGRLVENAPGDKVEHNWVKGNLLHSQEATNQILLRQGELFPYAGALGVYRCPADRTQANGAPRVRSFAMNGWIGGRSMERTGEQARFRTFVRESELAAVKPSAIWMIMDEHEATLDDGWFLVTMDDSRPFASLPATHHGRAYNLNFADAHVELFKLHDPETLGFAGTEAALRFSAKNADWLRLKQFTTVR